MMEQATCVPIQNVLCISCLICRRKTPTVQAVLKAEYLAGLSRHQAGHLGRMKASRCMATKYDLQIASGVKGIE